MAVTITTSPKGNNRKVQAASANFVVPSSSTAGSKNSTVRIPYGASVIGVVCKTNVALAGGTNVTVKIGDAEGGSAVAITAAIITADLNAALKQDMSVAVAPAGLTDAALSSGLISITTTGTYSACDIDVTVIYVA